ncbi:MAG: hypothetical protein KF857_01990 [Fimbriimonadaceae bacterium]|nr:hypothetical protein [Fimbriimonadaceae bacterium]
MVAVFTVLSLARPGADVAQLDDWATKRDIASIGAVASPEAAKALTPVKVNGAYGGGSKGWHALSLVAPAGGQSYVVFTSPQTCEDYGDLVFTWADGKLTRYIPESDVLGVRAVHEDLDIRFEPTKRTAHIVADVRVSREATAGPSFFLRISPNYRVKSVTREGQTVPYAQAGGVVALPTPHEPSAVFRVAYDAVVDQLGFAGAIRDDEALLTNDYFWLHTGRLPLTHTTTAHVPADWEVMAMGEPVSSKTVGGEKTVVTKMDLAVSYLSFSAGKYKVARKKVNGIEFFVASTKMTDEEMRLQLELMPQVTKDLSRYGRYPFSRWGAVDSTLYVGGALEAYSFATYGHGWLPDDDRHEPSHTWFGGMLSNTYLKSFWNESFADYAGPRSARRSSLGNAVEQDRAFLTHPSPGRLWDTATCRDSGAQKGAVGSELGYGKGGFVLQQLELEMGPEAMDSALAHWVADRKNGTPSEWDDFERSLGDNWKWFFSQWLDRTGWPEVKFTDARYGDGRVSLDYEFTGQPYRMTLEVWVEDAKGGSLHKFTVGGEGRESKGTVHFAVAAKPDLVVVDPYRRTLASRRSGAGAPLTFAASMRFKSVVDSRHADWAEKGTPQMVDDDLDHVKLVGHPDTMPALKPVLEKAGVAFFGDTFTFKGQRFDLKDYSVVGVVQTGGKTTAFQVGGLRRDAVVGDAAVAVVDKLGRFIRGTTHPVRTGANALVVK